MAQRTFFAINTSSLSAGQRFYCVETPVLFRLEYLVPFRSRWERYVELFGHALRNILSFCQPRHLRMWPSWNVSYTLRRVSFL